MSIPEDLISNLPDPILHKILSFLPTKDAVRQSILSKRWEYLWMSTSNLDFKEGFSRKRNRFMNFVERVLQLRNPLTIEKFSLSCKLLSDASRINTWILFIAKTQKLQEIDLCFHTFQGPYALPDNLCNESLQTLRLSIFGELLFPPAIYFSNLKNLTLHKIRFPVDHLTQKLFSGCPVLKELIIHECSWEKVKAICICCPMLENLDIIDNIVDLGGYYYHHNAAVDVDRCQVVIFGTSLKYFSYVGEFKNDYCLYDTCELVDAKIEVRSSGLLGREREVAYRVVKVLREISDVKKLILSLYTLVALDHAKEMFAHLPVFHKLTHLESTNLCPMVFFCPSLQHMLQNSPCLAYLRVIMTNSCRSQMLTLDPVPPFVSTHLKIMKIPFFFRNEENMNILKTLLKEATALEKMEVTVYDRKVIENAEERQAFFAQVLKLPTSSPFCAISINLFPFPSLGS